MVRVLNRSWAGLFLLIALVVATLPAVPAQTVDRPAPPPSVVAEVYRVEGYDPSNPTYQSWWNLTFQLSEQDPDQTTGSFNYSAYLVGGQLGPFNLSLSSRQAVPDRPGWVWYTTDSGIGVGDADTFTLQVWAEGTTENSLFSCSVDLTLRVNNSHSQCGTAIEAPQGVRALVTRESTDTQSAQVNVTYRLSDDDPDAEAGDFTYWVYAQGEQTDVDQSGFSERVLIATDTTPGTDGLRSILHEPFLGVGTITFYYDVVAWDPGTNRISEASCRVAVSPNRLYDSAACGTLGALAGGPDLGETAFPFTNVSQITDSSGLTDGQVAAFFAVGAVVGIGAVALVLGGVVAGAFAAVSGLALVALLGLMPLYVLVVIFLLAVTVIVFRLRGGGGVA